MSHKNKQNGSNGTSEDIPMKSVQIPAAEHQKIVVAAKASGLKISRIYRQAIELWLEANGGAAQGGAQ